MRRLALPSGWCVAAICASLASTTARAANGGVAAGVESTDVGAVRAGKTLRVVLLSSAADDWSARAWGQLSDLPVVLDSAEHALDPSEPLPRLARAHAADVVVWLALDPPAGSEPRADADGGTRIVIYEAREQRFHTRTVGADWASLNAEDRSAALEVAALTLRSVLRSLLERAEALPAEASPAGRLRAGLGASWQLDGQTSRGAVSLGGELGVAWQHWTFALGGQWGLAADVAAPETTLRLVRHAVFLEARHHFSEIGALELGVLVRAGLAVTQRQTLVKSELVVPLPDVTQTSALVGAGAVGRWRLSADHALELTLVGSGYTAPSRPLIRDAETWEQRDYPLWTLQPSAALGWASTF